MPIDREQVRQIARLAHLELDATELEAMRHDLESILDYVARLDELDVAGVPSTSHTLSRGQELRPDELRPSLGARKATANATEAAAGFFRVPRVLGDQDD